MLWALVVVFLACSCQAKRLAGGLHSFHSIQSNGQVFSFGQNTFGELGDNSTVNRNTPVLMQEVYQASDISSSFSFTCLVDLDGAVQCVGDNAWFQLGDGTNQPKKVVVQIPSLTSGVAKVFAGQTHACVLMVNGGVQCWGRNQFGALGDGTNTTKKLPTPVVGFEQIGAVGVSVGVDHTCLVTQWGSVECSGSNKYRSLGDGTAQNRWQMQPVVGLDVGMVSVSSGNAHNCAMDIQNQVWCWGNGMYGQLGSGRNGNLAIPIQVVSLGSGNKNVFCGPETTMVVRADSGNATVFGRNDFGQFGTKARSQFNLPIDFMGGTRLGIREMRSAHSAICVLLDDGVQCLGSDAYGQLGAKFPKSSSLVLLNAIGEDSTAITTLQPTKQPTFVPPPKPLINQGKLLAMGFTHVCSLQWNSDVYCFGSNTFGELGDGTMTNQPSPVLMLNVVGKPVDISAGDKLTCLVTELGDVACIGKNDVGQLGDEANPMRNASRVFCGKNHVCALEMGGMVSCWGGNEFGKLGIDSLVPYLVSANSIVVPQQLGAIQQLGLGESHTCLVTVQGQVACAGQNTYGQLGDGTQSPSKLQFIPVVFNAVKQTLSVAVGTWHSCALSTSGGVACWGLLYFAELGSELHVLAPMVPAGLEMGVVFLSCAGQDTFAIHGGDGSASAFGSNVAGQFATGDNQPYNIPVAFARGARRNLLELRGGLVSVCAMDQELGAVQCVGDDFYGQLGNGLPRSLSLQLVDANQLPVPATLSPSVLATAEPTASQSPTPLSPSLAPTFEPDTDSPAVEPDVPTLSPTSSVSSTAMPTAMPTLNDTEGEGTTFNFSSPVNGLLVVIGISICAVPIILHGRSRQA
ncbi:hypothetical protein BASA81_003175 [Batrachochytrium salamandrivorans]|nr:hypothetical protein BASA81_003175 [Batrachochytrium salamandrivorans]